MNRGENERWTALWTDRCGVSGGGWTQTGHQKDWNHVLGCMVLNQGSRACYEASENVEWGRQGDLGLFKGVVYCFFSLHGCVKMKKITINHPFKIRQYNY